jgi:hypothetical protein
MHATVLQPLPNQGALDTIKSRLEIHHASVQRLAQTTVFLYQVVQHKQVIVGSQATPESRLGNSPQPVLLGMLGQAVIEATRVKLAEALSHSNATVFADVRGVAALWHRAQVIQS